MAIDPTFSTLGPEWQLGPLEGPAPQAEPGSGSFGQMLGTAMDSLGATQDQAAEASRALAAGEVSDPTAVVMAVERAQLAMQLASQIRTRAVEAAQDIFHTQV